MNLQKIQGLLLNLSELALAISEELGTTGNVTGITEMDSAAPTSTVALMTPVVAPTASKDLSENAQVATVQTPVVPTVAQAPDDASGNLVSSTPIAPQETVEVVAPTVAPSLSDLDDEGFPWDERIHSAKKTKVKSNLVKGGEAWRMKKGLNNPELVKSVREEYKPEIATNPTTEALIAPVAAAPVTPVTPVAPVAAVVDHKANAVKIINKLENIHSVPMDDILDVLVNDFKATNGFESILPEQFEAVEKRYQEVIETYDDAAKLISEIKEWGGDEHAQGIDESLTGIFASYDGAESLSGVYYTQIPDLIELNLLPYHASWSAFVAGQE